MRKQYDPIEQDIIDQWKELGFFYDRDDRLHVNQWRFFGSKAGLLNFAEILESFAKRAKTGDDFAHEHLGPYWYLTLVISDEPQLRAYGVFGSNSDFEGLAGLIRSTEAELNPGDTISFDRFYGVENEVTAKWFVMANSFDPASMVELIVSGRQSVVNQKR